MTIYECDCCGRKCSRIHHLTAYGMDTSACDRCYQYHADAYGEEPDWVLETDPDDMAQWLAWRDNEPPVDGE